MERAVIDTIFDNFSNFFETPKAWDVKSIHKFLILRQTYAHNEVGTSIQKEASHIIVDIASNHDRGMNVFS